MLNHRLKSRVKIIKEYGNVPMVECHSSQINQVFMNIIGKGIDILE